LLLVEVVVDMAALVHLEAVVVEREDLELALH
jgi:hypothetical protein